MTPPPADAAAGGLRARSGSRREPSAGGGVSPPVREEHVPLRRSVEIRHRLGLHARPAADFVRLANTFTSDIRIKKGRRVVNGKSIMGLLTLAAAARTRIVLEAEGPDAEDALRVLSDFLAAGEEGAQR